MPETVAARLGPDPRRLWLSKGIGVPLGAVSVVLALGLGGGLAASGGSNTAPGLAVGALLLVAGILGIVIGLRQYRGYQPEVLELTADRVRLVPPGGAPQEVARADVAKVVYRYRPANRGSSGIGRLTLLGASGGDLASWDVSPWLGPARVRDFFARAGLECDAGMAKRGELG